MTVWIHKLPYFNFSPYHTSVHLDGFAYHGTFVLRPVFPFPALTILLCPHSSVCIRYRIFYLFSIDYVFRPRLRSRLTQSRSALLWKPWIFGLEDSHFYLATHSGILSSVSSIVASASTSSYRRMLPYQCFHSIASVVCFSPVYFRRKSSRLVSYYALFE